MENPDPKSGDTRKRVACAGALILVAAVSLALIGVLLDRGNDAAGTGEQVDDAMPVLRLIPSEVLGVAVDSEISLEELASKQIVLYSVEGGAQATCSFELFSVYGGSREGYGILLESGQPTGIRIGAGNCTIAGEDDAGLLRACHAFVCLREGMDCLEDIMGVREMLLESRTVSLIIENGTGAGAGTGYLEIMGALGFLQAELSDASLDGTLDVEELASQAFTIRTYVMNGDTCTEKAVESGLQEPAETDTGQAPCVLDNAIILRNSDANSISLEGSTVYIEGDDDHLRKASVIVRDIISPAWIRAYNGLG